MPLRLATLAVALLAAAPALAQSGASEEKGPTTIDAEQLEQIGDFEVTARGNAEIRQEELVIFGDVLRYNREFGRIEADGGARLQSGVDRFFGPRLRYSTIDDTGLFEQPSFLLQRVDPTRGNADQLEFLGKEAYRFKNARYTTCEPGHDDWRLEADELELDYESGEGRAKSPRLKFFDTTVLAAPFAFFPLEHRRKSGFLTPYYGSNSRRGLEVGIPYYWNIAPERDATITPIYMSRRGLLLKNEARYMERSYAGEARFEYMPQDKAFGGSRQGMSWQHTQTILPNLRAVVDYNRVSDDRYFVDLASQVRQVSIGNLQQDAYVTYNNTALGVGYGLQARVQRFQTLQDPLAPITPPYHRVPQLNFTAGKNDIGGFVDASVPGEYVRFTHPTLVEGSRVLLTPSFAAPTLAPGWFVTPKTGVRYASYSLDHLALGQETAPRVAIPWFSVDSGLIFEREARWFGETLTQTFEPRLYYLNVPFRNQDQIPLFDTGLADFTFAQLFTENRFTGGDRFGDANELTFAMTSRFLGAGGQEAFRATVGQRYFLRDERVGLTPTTPASARRTSDLLASVGGRVFRHWTFDTTAQYNPHDKRAERYTVSTRYAPEIAKVISASYRFNRETIRQIDISGQWPVATGWYAIGRYNYSLLDKRLLEGIAGLEYNAGCWVFRVVAQRVQAAAQVASTAFYLQLELRGVGEVGTDEALNLMRRNVSGYSVTNPKDPALIPPSMQRPLPFQQIF